MNLRKPAPLNWAKLIIGLSAAVALLASPLAHAGNVAFTYNNTAAIPIYDYYPPNPSVSTINVPAFSGILQSITVSVYGLYDAQTPSIELLLQSPAGQGLDLMYEAGNGFATNVNLMIADYGSPFPNGSLVSGTYRPSAVNYTVFSPLYGSNTINTLSGFVGSATTGTWTLSEYYSGYAGSDGNISGGWTITFNVFEDAPAVTTLAAPSITASNAALSEVVTPNGLSTMEYFEYGVTTNYGQFTATNTLSADLVDPQTNTVVVAVPPGTTIHYQAVAQNSLGTNYGGDLTFVTPVSQIFVSASLANLSTLLLTVNGNVGSNYVVLGSTNLAAAWTPIVTNTLTNSTQPIYVVPTTNTLEFFKVQQQ